MVMTVLMAASSATAAVLPQALVSSSSKGRSSSQGYGELCRLASRRRVCVRESFRSWKPLTTCALASSVSSRYCSLCTCLSVCVSACVFVHVCVCWGGGSSLHTHNTQSLLHCINYQEGNRYDLGIFFLLVFVVHGVGSLQPISRLWNPNPNIRKLGVRTKHTRVERSLTSCPLKDLILTLGVEELSVLCVCVCGLCSDSIRSVKKGSPVCLWIVQGLY
jgi:hypothetical protein